MKHAAAHVVAVLPKMACILAACVGLGCSPILRTPPSGPFPLNARFAIVDFPPPPAQVQNVPADPGPACLWVDGYFTWQGRRWAWVPGGWRKVRSSCYRTEATMAWLPAEAGAILYYAEPAWYEKSPGEGGETLARTPAECAPTPKSPAECRQP